MRYPKFLAPTVLLALVTSGCADVLSSGPITLTAADVNLLFTEVGGVFDQADLSLSRSGAGTASSSMRLSIAASIGTTVDCAGGGSAAFSGTSAGAQSSQDVTATFTGCKTAHYTIDGSLHETDALSSSTITRTGAGDLTLTTTDKRSGSCHVDFTVTIATGGTTTVTGTICGVSASQIAAIS